MRRASLLLLILVAFLAAHSAFAEQGDRAGYQVCTITSLKQGSYDGIVPFRDLKQFGDFGIGTVDGLDGEMVAVDGRFFQIKTDAKAYEIGDSEKTPFAVVTFFKPEKKLLLKRVADFKELGKILDDLIPSKDLPYAIKIEAKFPSLKARSVPGQKRPYPVLETVLKNQVTFDLKDVEGTLVGFRFPDYMEGVNASGYHFHFVDRDMKTGGHVLDCSAEDVKIGLSSLSELRITFPNVPGTK